jgi:O-Antigen ligase
VTSVAWRRVGVVERAAYLPGVAATVVLVAVGTAQGGFRPATWRLATAALGALAGAALSLRPRVALARRELVALAALAGYAAWTLMSRVWSIDASASVLESERALLYVAAVALVLLAVERRSLEWVVAGAVAGITVVAAVGLYQHYLTSRPLDPIEHRLLIEPLGYSNALGMFAGIGIVLSLGLVLRPSAPSLRAAAAVPLLVLVPTLLLTSSRGAAAAVAVGIVATVYLSGRIRSRTLLVGLLVAGVAAGIVAGTGRHQSLSPVSDKRPGYWRVAADEVAAYPALGSGGGTFGDYYWRFHRPSSGFAREAHSLYLQTLGELGPVGLVLLLVGLGLPLTRLGSARPELAGAGGAYAAFLAHAAIDWDWQVPALTLAGLLCGGLVLVGARTGSERPFSERGRRGLLALSIGVALLAAVRYLTAPGLAA